MTEVLSLFCSTPINVKGPEYLEVNDNDGDKMNTQEYTHNEDTLKHKVTRQNVEATKSQDKNKLSKKIPKTKNIQKSTKDKKSQITTKML